MNFKKITLTLFVFTMLSWACGGQEQSEKENDTKDNAAPTESTEVEVEKVENKTAPDSENNTDANSETKQTNTGGIEYYAQQYEDKFIKNRTQGIEVKKNIGKPNGYAKFTWSPGMAGEEVTLALWITKDKREILGAFTGLYGGMSDGGETENLVFYDNKWNNITTSVIPLSDVKNLVNSNKQGGDMNQFKAIIPQSGTSIKLKYQMKDIGVLNFDQNSGKFTLSK